MVLILDYKFIYNIIYINISYRYTDELFFLSILWVHYAVSVWKQFVFDCTTCPGSSDPFNIVTHYIKRVTNTWTYSNKALLHSFLLVYRIEQKKFGNLID